MTIKTNHDKRSRNLYSSSGCGLVDCNLGCFRLDETFFALGRSVVVVGGFSSSSNCLSVNRSLYQSALQSRKPNWKLEKPAYHDSIQEEGIQEDELPFGNLACPIASFRNFIECLAKFTSISSWLFTVNAHIKELAIIWIGIAWVRSSNACVNFRASEFEQF